MSNSNEGDTSANKPLFRDLTGDDPDPEISEIESLCLECRENGITRMLLTRIPFYKDVVLFSFHCSHCGWENNELQPASMIQEQGIEFILKVTNVKDLSRQIVKTEWASVTIPEISLEIPSKTQEGVVTTIEGVLQRAITGIGQKQHYLLESDPESAGKLAEFLLKLTELLEVTSAFTFKLYDTSGNSFVENPYAPKADVDMEIRHFSRSEEEDNRLGIAKANEGSYNGPSEQEVENEILSFSTNCPSCNAPCETNMKVTPIPNFKDAVIMATNCTACGYRTNEVKSGSGIEPLGTRISLLITDNHDLMRDVLKSETCRIELPELELEVGGAALGGKFTTVEGLLQDIKQQLKGKNPFLEGDSAIEDNKGRMDEFLSKIDEVIDLKRSVTLVLDDPCGNSYLEKLESPSGDNRRTATKYERTYDQNEELGLNDMKTENYQES